MRRISCFNHLFTNWHIAASAMVCSLAFVACQEAASVGDDDEGFDVCRHSDGPLRQPLIGSPQLCGSCDPTCYQTLDVPDDADLTAENAQGLCYDEDLEGLILCGGGASTPGGLYAFVANAPDSTVSKMSLETGAEVGRYLVGLPGKRCSCWCNGCNQPSRTAVDSRGFGYVASRGFGGQGSITKIAGDESTCVDRNVNGKIETSTGGADLKTWGADECVIWTVNVGGRDSVPRALAIDAQDRLWVGAHNEKRFYVLKTSDGSLIDSIDVDLRPYGAAIGPQGKVWFPDNCCTRRRIQYIDSTTFEKSSAIRNTGDCAGSYGIAVDTKGRVILGGWKEPCVSRYDPESNTWERFKLKRNTGYSRGVTIDADGRIWTASEKTTNSSGPHWLTSWDEDGTMEVHTVSGCGVPIGVAADFSGHMWTVCQRTSKIARLEIATGKVKTFRVGPSPYTYSDFTGFLRATVAAPEGSYTRLHDSALSCEDDREALWSQLYWEVDTPEGTMVEFWGRTAETIDDLTFAPDVLLATVPPATSPASVSTAFDGDSVLNHQRYLEVRVRVHASEDGESAVFTNMRLVHYCRCTCDVDATCSSDCACDDDC